MACCVFLGWGGPGDNWGEWDPPEWHPGPCPELWAGGGWGPRCPRERAQGRGSMWERESPGAPGPGLEHPRDKWVHVCASSTVSLGFVFQEEMHRPAFWCCQGNIRDITWYNQSTFHPHVFVAAVWNCLCLCLSSSCLPSQAPDHTPIFWLLILQASNSAILLPSSSQPPHNIISSHSPPFLVCNFL